MKSAIPKTVKLGFSLGLLVLALSAVLPYHNVQLLRNSERWVYHTIEVLQAAETLRISVTEAEASQRGFFLTRNPAYRESYDAARKTISGQLKSLTALTTDNSQQQTHLAVLNKLIDIKFKQLPATTDLPDIARYDALQDGVAVESEAMSSEQIRAAVNNFQSLEKNLLTQRVDDTRVHYQQTLYSFLSITALNFLLFVGLYLFIVRNLRARRTAELLLTSQSNLVSSVVNSMSEGLYVIDTQGKTILHNPVLAEVYGKNVAGFGPTIGLISTIFHGLTDQPSMLAIFQR